MVYACNHWELCGGLGNRINGMLTVFILAVLTNRSFFIELEYPVPVEAFFLPRRRADGEYSLDWRVKLMSGAASHSLNYIADMESFFHDLDWIADSTIPVLFVSLNTRELSGIIQHPRFRGLAQELGLASMPYLLNQVWNLLFEPTRLVYDRLATVYEPLRGSSDHAQEGSGALARIRGVSSFSREPFIATLARTPYSSLKMTN